MIKTSNVTKILAGILLIVMVMMTLQPIVSADAKSIVEKIDTSTKNHENDDSSTLTETAGKVIALIRNIAVIAGVILLSVLGVKYMMGSVEEKAEYKKSLMPLVIGIIVVMAASQIVTMIFGFVA